MRRPSFRVLLILAALAAACAPASGQPRFNAPLLPEATSIPIPAQARTVASLPERIESFAVSPDANTLGLAARGEVRLYDLHSYKLLRTIKNGELNSRLAWSPDGKRLALGGSKDYGTPFFTGGDSSNSSKLHITVYDASTWKLVFEPSFENEMVNQMVWDLAWSPDGRSLAFSTDIGGVFVIDAQTGALLSRQTGFGSTVTSLAWSPDGMRLLANHDTAYGIRRWKVSDDDTAVRLFDQRVGSSMAIAWSPDGERIASGHIGGGVCFWTAASNRCEGFLRAHQSATFSLAWSPDGQAIVTGGGVLRTWDANTGALIRSFGEVPGSTYPQVEWPAPQASSAANGAAGPAPQLSSAANEAAGPVASGPIISLESSFQEPGNTMLRLWDPQTGSVLAQFRGQER